MNPVFTIMHALKYLQQNTPPSFRTQGRHDAMQMLSDTYQAFEEEHKQARCHVED